MSFIQEGGNAHSARTGKCFSSCCLHVVCVQVHTWKGNVWIDEVTMQKDTLTKRSHILAQRKSLLYIYSVYTYSVIKTLANNNSAVQF